MKPRQAAGAREPGERQQDQATRLGDRDRRGDDPRPSRALHGDALTDEGFGEKTLRQAAQRLGVIIERHWQGKLFTWRLPERETLQFGPLPERPESTELEPTESAQAARHLRSANTNGPNAPARTKAT